MYAALQSLRKLLIETVSLNYFLREFQYYSLVLTAIPIVNEERLFFSARTFQGYVNFCTIMLLCASH
jgi:hypothetical protein